MHPWGPVIQDYGGNNYCGSFPPMRSINLRALLLYDAVVGFSLIGRSADYRHTQNLLLRGLVIRDYDRARKVLRISSTDGFNNLRELLLRRRGSYI